MGVCLVILVWRGSRHFCNTKINCERRWRKRGTVPLCKVAVQMGDFLPNIRTEGTYCISGAAFTDGFKQLESPASWHTTDLSSQMTGFKRGELKARFPNFAFLAVIRKHNIPRCIWVADSLMTIRYHHNQSSPVCEDWALSPVTLNSKLYKQHYRFFPD